MRRIATLTAMVLPVVMVLVFTASALASTSPHSGYSSSTDFCIKCHDIHEAMGDYVLTRAATVTATCGTCHGLFGDAAPADMTWTNEPADFAGANPTASSKLAYKVNMSAMTATEMDAVPGHSLGIMYGGTVVRSGDTIPGSSQILKVMTSGQYGGPEVGLYGGESVATFDGTKGLYCASCHTPHDGFGQMIGGTKLLSSKPNHIGTAVTTTYNFCAACHDKRDNDGPEKNHPASFCLNCHNNPGGGTDFPHTSTNMRILAQEPDALCTSCHAAGTLP